MAGAFFPTSLLPEWVPQTSFPWNVRRVPQELTLNKVDKRLHKAIGSVFARLVTASRGHSVELRSLEHNWKTSGPTRPTGTAEPFVCASRPLPALRALLPFRRPEPYLNEIPTEGCSAVVPCRGCTTCWVTEIGQTQFSRAEGDYYRVWKFL